MNSLLRNLIGAAALIATLSFAYAAYSYVEIYDRSSEPSNFRSFSVSAEGEVVAVPDIAQFSFSVITEGGTDVASLQQENTGKMNAVIEFVKGEGIDKKDIKTENYSIEPRYTYQNCEGGRNCPPPSISGYTVRQSAVVKIRDFAKISTLLGNVVKKGANSVSQLSFTIDDPTMVENEARAKAIVKAQEKAEAIAEAGGFSVGRLLSISENNYGYPMMARSYAYDKAELGAVGGEIAPQIEPGSEELRINVTLQYEID
ncbi:MAG: SIMPL domain-containing protein [bacterium]|nr:SIMPL domain-containing protein [bacterium]